jgi:AcrR family transcriptional regulator
MSTPYEQGGYVNPKRRTRQALVNAARDIVASGRAPKVEEAATAAGVSRTTAYRYFPNQAALLVAAHPEVGAPTLLDVDAPADVVARLDAVVDRFVQLILATEVQQRTMLRLSLDPDPQRRADLPLRQGRAIGWIETALEPLRAELGDDAVHRLALAVRSATGIEALVWLTDVAGLSRDAAADTMRWSARAMLAAAVVPGGAPG